MGNQNKIKTIGRKGNRVSTHIYYKSKGIRSKATIYYMKLKYQALRHKNKPLDVFAYWIAYKHGLTLIQDDIGTYWSDMTAVDYDRINEILDEYDKLSFWTQCYHDWKAARAYPDFRDLRGY